ncbi:MULTISPECIES: hypothetical protein [Streptomyces]|uniref:Uncharacterized protein n=2 Tax=Streptomyces TaxID=1883 RepID=A0ABV9J8L6_9ACTN
MLELRQTLTLANVAEKISTSAGRADQLAKGRQPSRSTPDCWLIVYAVKSLARTGDTGLAEAGDRLRPLVTNGM